MALGTIRDVAILEELPIDSRGIEVPIPGTRLGAESNKGAFLLSGVPGGAYKLREEAPDYINATVLRATITLVPDIAAPAAALTFELHSYANGLQETNKGLNCALAGAAAIGSGASDSGAIEVVGAGTTTR